MIRHVEKISTAQVFVPLRFPGPESGSGDRGTARRQRLSVWRERHGPNDVGMPLKSCSLRVVRSLPVATFQSLIVRSALPEASALPSGVKATE